MSEEKICAWCHHARMRTDICGIYCTGGFENPDGTCDHFRDSKKVPTENDKLVEAMCHRCPVDECA